MWTRPLLRRVNRVARAVLQKLPAAPRPAAQAPRVVRWQRILLVKLVGMGDSVMVRSLADHLQRLVPDAGIGVLAGPATREVLGVNSNFMVHHYDPSGSDRGIWRALAKVREIREQSYDVVVDFEQHLVLTALFLRLTGIPSRIGLAAPDNPRTRFQTHTVALSGGQSMWGAYTNLAGLVAPELLGVSTTPLPCSPDAGRSVDLWWQASGLDGARRVVALHLGCGARAAARRWPVKRFAQLAERLCVGGYADAVILTGTADEQPLVREFVAGFSGRAVDATGLGTIERTAEALRRCNLAVSNDTGLMHLAAAMGVPTIGLFGPNTPRRYAPVGPHTASVYATCVPCSPCINIHQGVVPECSNPTKGRCLLDIRVDEVLRAIELLTRATDTEPGGRTAAPVGHTETRKAS